MLYAIAISVGLAGVSWFLVIYRCIFGPRLAAAQRLEEAARATGKKTVREEELSRPLFERVLRPLWVGLVTLGQQMPFGKAGQHLLRKLERAGQPGGLAPDEVLVLKYAAGLLLGALGGAAGWVLGLPAVLLAMAGLLPFIGGWVGVDAYLYRKAARRRERLITQLPNALDLLTVSVEAGLGFEGALLKVAEKMPGALAEEFARTLREIQMGKPRKDALRDMAERTGVEDVHTFVGAVVTGEEFGVSIAAILREQANALRQKRRCQAQEAAMKAPVKMLFPLIFLIFPALIIVLLGPAFIQLMKMIW